MFTWFHAVQLVLAAAIVPIVLERLRTLFFEAPIEARPVLRLLGPALREGDYDRALDLAARGRPAWICELVVQTLEEAEAGGEGATALAIEEQLVQLRFRATQRVAALKALGRVGTSLGVLGAVGELMLALTGTQGLEGLMAGLPERIAMERGLLSVAIGVTTSLFCLATARLLARQASRLLREVRETADLLERTLLEGPSDG